MVVKVSAKAREGIEARGFDAEEICGQIAEKVDAKMPPKHEQDTADNISLYDLELSWIRDNIKREFIVLTRQEAKYLDGVNLKDYLS